MAEKDMGASASQTGLSQVEPQEGLAGFAASIPSADLLELADKVTALPHMSRSLSGEIGTLFGEQFNYNFGYIDSANRLAIEGWSWCAGLSVDDDGYKTYWANVHSAVGPGDSARIDISIHAATEAIALTAAWLTAHARIAQAIEARSDETAGLGPQGESAVGSADAPEVT